MDWTPWIRRKMAVVAAMLLPALAMTLYVWMKWGPRWWVDPPAYDLVFSALDSATPGGRGLEIRYGVEDGKVLAVARHARGGTVFLRSLYYYDRDSGTARRMTLSLPARLDHVADGQVLGIFTFGGKRVDSHVTAPDGYRWGENPDAQPGAAAELIFGPKGAYRHFVEKDGAVWPVPADGRVFQDVRFIGWVIPQTDARRKDRAARLAGGQ